MVDIYSLKISKDYEFVKKPHTDFESGIQEEERKELVRFVTNGTSSFNGSSVRLDRITGKEKQRFEVSEVEFYDFLSTNMICLKSAELLKKKQSEKMMRYYMALAGKVTQRVEEETKLDSLESVLANKRLANIMAVSVLVRDVNGKFGIVKRGKNLAIGSGFLGVTATGSVDHNDFAKKDPVCSCAKRELREELNIAPQTLEVDYLVMSKKKMQPVFIVEGVIENTWEDIIKRMKQARDYKEEVMRFYAVPGEKLLAFTQGETMTDAARFHVEKVAEKYEKENELIENKAQFEL